ncbi:uncharacterized protein N7479_009482 [Penicillium vulpinum]|uniref:uncharacterized protein n=1 Tax=Penicillium vulpinum TaxID=29845 RepID=UPI00254847BE|nr:uncharacterized protein N7479_009482 [Penicillium vulpinum]KAJ5951069.1 hypothetical protein N7479_009482 [Penicillium vulpinum]
MGIPSTKEIDEVAKVVWASHILSYWNPYTTPMPDKLQSPSDGNTTDDDEDYDNSSDIDGTSTDTAMLAGGDEALCEKFLNCISELLAHTKGGKHVTAAALREKEGSIEIDIARNTGFSHKDDNYISSLTRFLARRGESNYYATHRCDLLRILTMSQGVSHQDAEDDHYFLRQTIVYNASRVSDAVTKAVGLLNGSPFCPVPRSSIESQSNDSTCLLGCCSKGHPLASNAIESLILQLLNFDFLKSKSLTSLEREDQICQIVELAALALRSSQEMQARLKDILPCADPLKVMKIWRIVARPATDLYILSRISWLLPNFRSVVFIKMSPPDPIRLQKRHKKSIQQAWKKLQLPAMDRSLPNNIAKKSGEFKRDCFDIPSVHCEIQLLARYEAEPSLTPTILYLGCSKKACFLCQRFLALSSLKLRVRGCHGQCHPSWGIPLLSLDTTQPRTRQLCEAIKEKIKSLIDPEPFSKTVAVQQSSAVSELNSTDMLVMKRQHARREITDRRGQEHREATQILYRHINSALGRT